MALPLLGKSLLSGRPINKGLGLSVKAWFRWGWRRGKLWGLAGECVWGLGVGVWGKPHAVATARGYRPPGVAKTGGYVASKRVSFFAYPWTVA